MHHSSKNFGLMTVRLHAIPKKTTSLNEPGSKLLVLGMVIQPLIGNPYNGYKKPYYWVDDHPLLYGNNGSLDPSTNDLQGGPMPSRSLQVGVVISPRISGVKQKNSYPFIIYKAIYRGYNMLQLITLFITTIGAHFVMRL